MDQEEQAGRSIAQLTRTKALHLRKVRNPHHERGWVGLIVLLLALVIVAIVAQTVLKQYGLGGGATPKSATPGDTPRGPGVAGAAPYDATSSQPVPVNAIERARSVERTIQQQAQDFGKRIEEDAK